MPVKLHWSVEPNGHITLRCAKNIPYAIVSHAEDKRQNYTGYLLEPGFPPTRPYRSRDRAAAAVGELIKQRHFPNAIIGEVPQFARPPIKKSKAA